MFKKIFPLDLSKANSGLFIWHLRSDSGSGVVDFWPERRPMPTEDLNRRSPTGMMGTTSSGAEEGSNDSESDGPGYDTDDRTDETGLLKVGTYIPWTVP